MSKYKNHQKSKSCFKYKEFVNLDSITTLPKAMHRFKLYIPFVGREHKKCVTIILHNPSLANCNFSDKTINSILALLFEANEYENVCIVNLTPIYGNESMLNNVLSDVRFLNDENNKIIKGAIDDSDDIILAWGDSDCNGEVKIIIEQTKEIIFEHLLNNKKPCFTFGKDLTVHGNPIHPIRKPLSKLGLISRKITKENNKYLLKENKVNNVL